MHDTNSSQLIIDQEKSYVKSNEKKVDNRKYAIDRLVTKAE